MEVKKEKEKKGNLNKEILRDIRISLYELHVDLDCLPAPYHRNETAISFRSSNMEIYI